jgi:DNA primase
LTGDYLYHRNITIATPATIRDHPGLKHGPTGQNLPAMVAAITGPDRKVTAIQRTFLRCDGRGKANVSAPKMTLGAIGAGAVRLGPAGPVLGIAEGIETGLSAMELFEVPVWCSLSASRLDRLWLPPEAHEIHLFADNGTPGHEAAASAAKAYQEQVHRVVLRFPPERFGDWNDALAAGFTA